MKLNKEEYTEKVHARMMLIILEISTETIISKCPKMLYEEMRMKYFDGCCTTRYSETGQYFNKLCKNFIGLPNDAKCPCEELGCQEAIKRTWIALEEKGYLE